MVLSSRGAAWTAACSALTAGAGLVAGAMPASAADLDADAAYSCVAGDAVYTARVSIAGTAPRSAVAGKPLSIGKVSVGVALPAALAKEIAAKEVAPAATPVASGMEGMDTRTPVTADARLFVTTSQGGEAFGAQWPAFRVAGAGEPGAGRTLDLRGTLAAPSVSPTVAGPVTWSAAGLVLTLHPATGSPLALTCVPKSAVRLGTVDVGGPAAATAAPEPGAATPAATADEPATCEAIPPPEDPATAFNPDPGVSLDAPDLPENPDVAPQYSTGRANCSRLSGFVNMKKVGAAAPIGAETRIRLPYVVYNDRTNNYIQQRGVAQALAVDSRVSILGFGFMPTTVSTQVRQAPGPASAGNSLGNFRGDLWNQISLPTTAENTAWVRTYVDVKAKDALVNGTPINLGPNCTAKPVLLKMSSYLGDDHIGKSVFTNGGTYTAANLTIPSFTGCGVGEDLSPLLTATAAGSGNYVSLESGKWCPLGTGPDPDPSVCDNEREPKTVTVSPGGDVTATAAPFVIRQNPISGEDKTIECESATMRMTMKAGKWQPRFRFAEARSVTFKNCKYNPAGMRVTVSTDTLPWTFNISDTPADPGNVTALFNGVVINVRADDGCNIRLGSRDTARPPGETYATLTGTFDNQTSSWNSNKSVAPLRRTPVEDCPTGSIDGFPNVYLNPVEANFAFKPAQKITIP
jgi:hypothetical protein